MTEYEAADLAFSKIFQIQGMGTLTIAQMSSVGEAIQQYMTVLFAYMAAAHFIGASLERRQAVIFSCLYLLWQFWTLTIIGIRSFGMTTTIEAVRELQGGVMPPPAHFASLISGGSIVILLGALAASLCFMRTIRLPNPE
jgi:hypothetical protein